MNERPVRMTMEWIEYIRTFALHLRAGRLDEMEIIALWAVLASCFVLLVFIALARGGDRHCRYRRKAKRTLAKLVSMGPDNFPGMMTYLRKVNPYVFEELVLTAFEKHGYKVRRNRRYSGDGGIDGRLRKGLRRYVVQCKRYSSYVNPEDVRQFVELCERSGRKGFFVHTGKTGRASKVAAGGGGPVTIISGDRLCRLMMDSAGAG